MNSKTIKIIKNIALAIAFSFILISFTSSSIIDVNAGSNVGGGVGGVPTQSGNGWWRQLVSNSGGSGTALGGGQASKSAWNQFVDTNTKYSGNPTGGLGYGLSSLKSAIDNMSVSGMNGSLSSLCEDSDVIFYHSFGPQGYQHGSGYPSAPANGVWWGGGNRYVSSHAWANNSSSTHTRSNWMKYNSAGHMLQTTGGGGPAGGTREPILRSYFSTFNSAWTSGRTVLICSASFTKPDPLAITVKANSGVRRYTGSTIRLSGAEVVGGALKQGDVLNVTAWGEGIEEGDYPTEVKSVTIMRGSNNVTGEYKITKQKGNLKIIKDIPQPPTETGPLDQCIDYRNFSFRGPVRVRTSAVSSKSGNGGSLGSSVFSGNEMTQLGSYVSGRPITSLIGSPESTLNSWMNTVNSLKWNTNSPSVSLSGFESNMSRYGGVVDIARNYQEQTFSARTCQPQKREVVPQVPVYAPVDPKKPDGEKYIVGYKPGPGDVGEGYTAWKNFGPRKVDWASSGGIYDQSDGGGNGAQNNYYQIMSVNCNRDEFNSIYSSYGSRRLSLASGDGSGVMQTRNYGYRGQLPLLGTRAGQNSFYTDGDSCKEAFKCTATKLSSSSNDAKNNRGDDQLFSEDQGGSFGTVNQDGELVFFRDNEDRQVRADLWYPRNPSAGDLSANSGQTPSETVVNWLPGGTPTIDKDMVTISPWGNEAGKLTSLGSRSYSGEVNKYLIKSQWSSDEGKPHKFEVSWRYQATATNIVPSRADGSNVLSMSSQRSYNFPIYCGFENVNNSNQQASVPNTPHVSGAGASPVFGKGSSIKTLFTRSVSDTNRLNNDTIIVGEYTVEFDTKGGNAIPSQIVKSGRRVSTPADPVKEGYKFLGWSPSLNNTIVKDTIFTAQWADADDRVVFDANGGRVSNKFVYGKAGSTITEFPTAQRDGYTFNGWYTSATGGSKVDSIVVTSEEQVLYAQWSVNQYTITVNTNGGEPIADITQDYNTVVVEPVPVRVGAKFVKWSVPFPERMPAKDIEVIAEWDTEKFTVVFMDRLVELSKVEVEYGQDVSSPAAPKRFGYTFLGWDKGLKNITEDTTISALWEKDIYTVIFKDGYTDKILDTQEVGYAESATAPTQPTRDGYEFIGWSKDFSSVREDMVVEGVWDVEKHQVIFNHGYIDADIDVQYVETGKAAVAPADPSAYGMIFDGWDKDFSNITEDTTITGKWIYEEYEVVFKDGHTGTIIDTQQVKHGFDAVLPADPTRVDYLFEGWDKDHRSILENTVIEATWKLNRIVESHWTGKTGSSTRTVWIDLGRQVKSVNSLSVNTGNVELLQTSGNRIQVRVSGGSYVDVYHGGSPADSKYVSGQTSRNYDSGGYSGTLSRYVYDDYDTTEEKYFSGMTSSTVSGWSGTLSSYTEKEWVPAHSKTVSQRNGDYGMHYRMPPGYGWQHYKTDSYPKTLSYNSGGYSGTLSCSGGARYNTLYDDYGTTKYKSDYYRVDCSGSVTRPGYWDTKTYYSGYLTKTTTHYVYRYRGTVYKPDTTYTAYYYNYNVTVDYMPQVD